MGWYLHGGRQNNKCLQKKGEGEVREIIRFYGGWRSLQICKGGGRNSRFLSEIGL